MNPPFNTLDRPSNRGISAKKHPFFWFTLALGIAMAFMYCYEGWVVWRFEPVTDSPGWSETWKAGKWLITEVDPHRAAAGKLKSADQILALNGDTRAGRVGTRSYEHFAKPGSPYSLRILRESRPLEVELAWPRGHEPRAVASAVSYLLVSLSFYGVSVLFGLTRPEDRVTQLGALVCFGVALRLVPLAMWPFDGMDRLGTAMRDAVDLPDPWHLAVGYHFYCYFCSNLLRERVWGMVRMTLYGITGIFFLVGAPLCWFYMLGEESVLSFSDQHLDFLLFHHLLHWNLRVVLELFALLAMCAANTASYLRVRDPDQRRRVRWIVFGSVAGLAPLLFFDAADSLIKWAGGDIRNIWPAGEDVTNMCLCVIPFATGYAVIKHRAMGISVVVRQSMKYLLARNVLRVVLLVPVLGLILPVVRNPNRTVVELFVEQSMYLNLILLAFLSLGLRYRVQVRNWLDRKFFREAYSQETILRELIGRIKELDSISEISKMVSREVESALHPRCLRAFYREKERSDLTLGYSSGPGSSEMRVPENSRMLQLLESNPRPMDFPMSGEIQLPDQERDWLEQLETSLIVPITGSRQRLMGLMLLGEKRSDEPYTRTDRNLLEAIAAQMGVVYERAWLQEQVGEEQRIRRDVLAHLDESDLNLLKECPQCGACFDNSARSCAADGAELTVTLPVERTVDRKYRLDRRIGRGGMGAVYEGTDLRLNRKVAIKVMMGSLFGNRAALRRFEREARAAALLNHVNIVAIHDFGMIGQDGAYLVMERVYGSTWRAQLQSTGALSPARAADWFRQLLAGLRAAHEAGVVHRDLKPENVLVSRLEDRSERIKILDFGLAKMRLLEGGETQSLTVAGGILGTIGYMSPEQLSGAEADERSDLFSVGVMAFEAITGRRPFEGRSYAEILNNMLRGQVQLPGNSSEIEALNAVLARCMANDPPARYPSVVALQEALLQALTACSVLTGNASPSGDIATRSLGAGDN